jgi:hypothetical protein
MADGIFQPARWRCPECRAEFPEPTPPVPEGIRPGICPICLKRHVLSRLRPRLYVTAWDLGRKRDPVVGVTVDAEEEVARIVAFRRGLRIPWPETVRWIAERDAAYPGRLLVDSTGLGDPVLWMDGMPAAEPVVFTPGLKIDMLQALMLLLEQGRLKGPATGHGIEQLWQELRDYRWDDDRLTQDCVMTLAMVAHAVRRPAPRVFRL